MKELLESLKAISAPVKILYVEDNLGLRTTIEELLKDFFTQLVIAEDGEDGYSKFKEFNPDIIISDINMPKMDGLTMASKVLKADPSKKIIILSAHDEKEKLLESIKIGVFRFVRKPTKADELLMNIYEAILALSRSQDQCLYQKYTSDVFNYQSNLVMMLDYNRPIIINKRMLDFFSLGDMDEFNERFPELDAMLLEHQGFLFSLPNKKWLDEAIENSNRIYHTKMVDSKKDYHHFILKVVKLPEREHHVVLSFNDISELNLMHIFDKNAASEDTRLRSREAAVSMLNVIKENNANLKVYNFYRGLSIVNDAVIARIDEANVTLKTQHSQLKIIDHVKHFTLTSEAFPESIFARISEAVNFDQQSIVFHDVQFQELSAANRKYTRLEVDKRSTATIIYREIKYPGNTKLIDISVCSAKIGIDALPAGVKIDDTLRISLVLTVVGSSPININTTAKILRVDEMPNQFQLIVLFKLSDHDYKKTKEYLSSRQVELIKEFRKL